MYKTVRLLASVLSCLSFAWRRMAHGGTLLAVLCLSTTLHAAWRPGLLGGYATRASYLDDQVVVTTTTNVWPCASAATNNTVGGTGLWAANRCWIYWGQVYLPTGNWSIASYNDDTCFIAVDGPFIHSQPGGASYSSNALAIDEAGWHGIVVRMGNGSGGAGPTTAALANMGGSFGFTRMAAPPQAITNDYVFPDGNGEILFRYDDGQGFDDGLFVSGVPGNYGTVVPPYGLTNNLDTGDSFLCSAPTGYVALAADTRASCAGYAVYNDDLDVVASGTTNAFLYTHDRHAVLDWQWIHAYLVEIVAGSGGTVDNSGGWYDAGETVTVTATPSDATRAFLRWSGDVSVEQMHEPVLQVACEAPLNITSHFGKAWYVAKTGNDANNGLTPSTAFATIAKGITSAAAGDVVLVGPGTYAITAKLSVTKGITIRGIEGAANTVVAGNNSFGPLIELGHADAVVEGFHFTKGSSSGVKILTGGGTFRKCIMSGSTYTSGAGLGVNMVAGRLSQCVITNNVGSDSTSGPGLYISGGVAENCFIANNRSSGAGVGGGVYMTGGTVRNCTILKNVTGRGGVYATGGTMENCLVWANVLQASYSQIVSSSANAKFFNCYLPPLAGDNLGVFTSCVFTNTAPNFRDAAANDYRLTAGSPAVDRGRSGSVIPVGSRDLDGHARLVGAQVDIGAYEFYPGEALACDIDAPLLEGVGTLDVTLAAVVAGAAPGSTPTCAWTTNGAAAGTSATLSLSLASPGYYTVGLTVDDGASTASVVRTNLLYVVPPVLYVSAGSGGAVFPYATPATAAATIQAAVDAARDGCAVEVGSGSYGLNASIMLNKPIELRTQAGPSQTRLYKTISDVVMLQLGHSQARFHGFDFDGGRPSVVRIWGNGGVVSNCVIRNGAYTSGSGVGVRALAGLVTHCVIRNNTSDREGGGIGAYLEGTAVVENCLIRDNRSSYAGTKGGGAYLKNSAALRNCTVVGNQAGNGGGVYTDGGGMVENCILYGNLVTAVPGTGDPDWYNVGTAAIYRNNCTPVAVGADCVTATPNFVDPAGGDYRLNAGSPCVDAGVDVAGFDGITDYYGGARVSGESIDIGAHEVVRVGAGCGIFTTTPHVLEGQSVTLGSVVYGFPEGATITYTWDFDGDAVPDATGASVTRLFPNGYLTVGLSVTDGTTSASVVQTNLVLVSAANIHVLPENPGATHPFDSWATAATNIQEAIDAGIAGSTVWIGDGLHRPGATIRLTSGMTVRGVNGPGATIIDPKTDARIFFVSHPEAVLSHLTLAGGRFGVQMDRGGGMLSDLVISNNYYGAGGDGGTGIRLYAGTVRRCVIAHNRQGGGSDTAGILISPRVDAGDPPVLVENCLIVSNRSTSSTGFVGGLYAQQGTVRNCTIVGNSSARSTYAGGVHATSAALIENCIIMDNVNTANATLANWAGTAASFRYTCTTPDLGGTANRTDNPRFVNAAAGDFRLLAGSPCINTGLTQAGMAQETDLSGGRRVWQRYVDIGALEYVPPAGSVLLVR